MNKEKIGSFTHFLSQANCQIILMEERVQEKPGLEGLVFDPLVTLPKIALPTVGNFLIISY